VPNAPGDPCLPLLVSQNARVSGELLREAIVPAIAPYAVGLNDEIGETRCDWETPNNFFGSIAEVDHYHSERDSLTNQAATGV
jgi:hypothetical protein